MTTFPDLATTQPIPTSDRPDRWAAFTAGVARTVRGLRRTSDVEDRARLLAVGSAAWKRHQAAGAVLVGVPVGAALAFAVWFAVLHPDARHSAAVYATAGLFVTVAGWVLGSIDSTRRMEHRSGYTVPAGTLYRAVGWSVAVLVPVIAVTVVVALGLHRVLGGSA